MSSCMFNGNHSECGFIDCAADMRCKKEMVKKQDIELVEFPARVFVYGTLKKGYGNHGTLGESKFLRNCSAFGILLQLGGFPGFLPVSTGMPVEGELYEVPDKATLDRLDRLEGHPSHYTREKINLIGGEMVWTYVYRRYYTASTMGLRTKWDIIPSGVYTGNNSGVVEFIGFFEDRWPPKTEGLACAHVRIRGEFGGLLDCFTGLILRDDLVRTGKPHLVYDLQEKVWKPLNPKGDKRPPIDMKPETDQKTVDSTPSAVAAIAAWVPYIDAADPGELNVVHKEVA